MSDREIAQRLVLAQGTVKWYYKQLYSKLDVHSRSEAVERARELGLLDETGRTLLSGTVTFLFTDIEGSIQLWEQHPEAMGAALQHHDALLCRALEAKDGRVFKTVGDAFCTVFDDATKALAAVHAAQAALWAQDWGETAILVRMALHTGTAELRNNDYFGPTVNHVARLLSAGHGGQTLVSATTRALVQDRIPDGPTLRDLGEHRLKDLDRAEGFTSSSRPMCRPTFPH